MDRLRVTRDGPDGELRVSDIVLTTLESSVEGLTAGEPILADWSPDGKILFVSDRGGKNQLWVIEEGTLPGLISDKEIMIYGEMPVIFCTGPRWSPDGKLIGYISPTDSAATLWLVDPETGTARATDLYGAHSFDWYYRNKNTFSLCRPMSSAGSLQ